MPTKKVYVSIETETEMEVFINTEDKIVFATISDSHRTEFLSVVALDKADIIELIVDLQKLITEL